MSDEKHAATSIALARAGQTARDVLMENRYDARRIRWQAHGLTLLRVDQFSMPNYSIDLIRRAIPTKYKINVTPGGSHMTCTPGKRPMTIDIVFWCCDDFSYQDWVYLLLIYTCTLQYKAI